MIPGANTQRERNHERTQQLRESSEENDGDEPKAKTEREREKSYRN